MKKQILNSEKELLELGESFGRSLNVKEIIVLSGPLGAGKTCFVKGIAKGLNIEQMITSPTFNIMKEYDDKLCHIDAYRIKEEDIGIDHYIDNNFIICIEWSENISDFIPYINYEIKLDYNGEGREIEIVKKG